MEVSLRGIGVSPGIVIGPAVTFHVQTLEIPEYTIDDVEAELARFTGALARSREELQHLHDQVEEELGQQHAAIFATHIEMLDDPALGPEIEGRIKSETLNAEHLLNELIAGYTKMLEQIDDPIFRERSSDFIDVSRRVLGNLLQRELETLENLEKPSVIVAHDLSPSETVNMDMTNALAVATDSGGPTSHMAILARAFEIPCVVALKSLGNQVTPDDTVIVDGSSGVVILRPDKQTLTRYEAEKIRIEAENLELLSAEKEGPALTQDGHEIPTLANIELLSETDHSLRANCQGIGLYRTEYLYMNRATLPSEEEQYQVYRQIVEKMAPLPVTIRTLDLGGDKLVSEITAEREANPQLGWRSIRLCLDRPDIFKAQLRALYRASVHGSMQIMFPMISGVDQLVEANEIVRQVREDLAARGVPFDPDMKVGTMIEVPATVAIAGMLAAETDFFSIGSNDLIQYCLAVDRVNPRTANLYQPTHPGVLHMLKQIVDAAKKADIPCSICGEMAGDFVLTELLLGLGFKSLSMSAVSLPRVRAEITRIRMAKAKRLAKKVLGMSSVSQISELLVQRYENHGTVAIEQRKTG